MIEVLDEKKLFLKTEFNNKFLVVLVKMATCPACIRFLPDWENLAKDPELVNDIGFLVLERFDKEDEQIIKKIDSFSKQYHYNRPEIDRFPSILIFKQDIDKTDHEYYENFKLYRMYLKTYLKELISHYKKH